jgi:hypothetical protein
LLSRRATVLEMSRRRAPELIPHNLGIYVKPLSTQLFEGKSEKKCVCIFVCKMDGTFAFLVFGKAVL